VRVLSDGDDGSGATVSASGPQSTTSSNGAAQTGATSADAPVRVLSEGDNAGSDAGAADEATPQVAASPSGTAQIASLRTRTPVRVASAGDDQTAEASAEGGPLAEDGAPQSEPSPPAEQDTSGGGESHVGGTGPPTSPAVDVQPDDGQGGVSPENVADVAGEAAGSGSGTLPLTGLRLLETVVAGVLLVASGLALRVTHPA
jgi:hypothetical protein